MTLYRLISWFGMVKVMITTKKQPTDYGQKPCSATRLVSRGIIWTLVGKELDEEETVPFIL